MKWYTYVLIFTIIGLIIASFFFGKGCNKEQPPVVIETTTPTQDSLFKAMDLLNQIKAQLDTSRTQTINKIDNEINYYSNYPDSLLDPVNVSIADTLRSKYRQYKSRQTD